MEFRPFPKLPRLSREVVITEKIDGTNASVFIEKFATPAVYVDDDTTVLALISDPYGMSYTVRAGSRTRWITPDDDNFGFAKWVADHAEELTQLGAGHHFGEWWGRGVQRHYEQTERHFSLFNTVRWCEYGQEPQRIATGDPRIEKYQEVLPSCCRLVPELWRGPFDTGAVSDAVIYLGFTGSKAAPGFRNPEGIVVFHTAAGVAFKKTIEKDEQPKGTQK